MNDAVLSELYDHLNRMVFGDRLPPSKDIELRFAEPSEMIVSSNLGEFRAEYDDNVLGDVVASYHFRILINSGVSSGEVEQTLLHEMIHLEIAQQHDTEEAHNKDIDFHSPKFENRAAEIKELTGITISMPDVVARKIRKRFGLT